MANNIPYNSKSSETSKVNNGYSNQTTEKSSESKSENKYSHFSGSGMNISDSTKVKKGSIESSSL